MIYPTIDELAGKDFNRYELVIGVAKGARIVVNIKGELEKIREQVQNIE